MVWDDADRLPYHHARGGSLSQYNRLLSLLEYFTVPFIGIYKPHSDKQDIAARILLSTVNRLLIELKWEFPVDPDTGTCISGARGGRGDGGFRAEDSTTGAPGSQHRAAHAVDVYDPTNKLDGLISNHNYDFDTKNSLLEKYGLYREAPTHTLGWCHLQDVSPKSGNRNFIP